MAAAGASSPLSEANLLALSGEEALEDIRELTLRNHKLHAFDHGDTERLINLQVMSLSHNLLSSLAGFQHLQHLLSLNLNFNALTSLDGIGHCTSLQHLFLANNRVREISPLVPCTNLQTLHLFRNNVANLDLTMVALANLTKLRELELAGNPCSLVPDYKHRVVLQLELASLDGDVINQLDYDLASEYFAANGGMPPELGPRVDILTLEEVEAGAGAASTATGPLVVAPSSDGHCTAAVATGDKAAGASARAAADVGTAAVAEPSARPNGGGAHQADANGRMLTSAWGSRPSSAAAGSIPGSAGPSGAPPLPLPRPGTGARRPGSASSASGRPGSAYSGIQSSVQLLTDEILNDHPVIIEYLAKHVLMEGLALTEQQQPPGWAAGGGAAGAGSGGGFGGGGGRGPTFAQRLRDTTAAMNACEDVDTKTLAGQQQELIATSQTVRRGIAEEMVATASPNELCRQLVRLCEVLIKEVEASRAGRPASSGGSGRPGTAIGLRPTTPGLHATPSASSTLSSVLTAPEAGELIQLRTDVERLCRENKQLRLENENMYWLVEEVKRLKTERGAHGT